MKWLKRLLFGEPCKNGTYRCWGRCHRCFAERVRAEQKERDYLKRYYGANLPEGSRLGPSLIKGMLTRER